MINNLLLIINENSDFNKYINKMKTIFYSNIFKNQNLSISDETRNFRVRGHKIYLKT
jgi:hypothetical protein